jgi:hypothetical protein
MNRDVPFQGTSFKVSTSRSPPEERSTVAPADQPETLNSLEGWRGQAPRNHFKLLFFYFSLHGFVCPREQNPVSCISDENAQVVILLPL